MRTISRGFFLVTLVFMLSVASFADNAKADTFPKTFSEPEDIGAMVTSAGTLDSTYGEEDGKQVMYTTVTGSPALFNVVDLENNELLRSLPLEGGGQAWGHVVDSNGLVYITAGTNLYRYSPETKAVTNLGRPVGATTLFGLVVDENDVVYGGTYPTGQVFKYDPETNEIYNYEQFSSNRDYVQDVAYYDGHVYGGTAAVGGLYKLDPEDGSRELIPFPEETGYTEDQAPGLFRMQSVREFLFIHMSSNPNIGLIYDMKNEEWVEVIENYRSMYVTPELEGKTYYIANGRFYEFDLETKESTPTETEYSSYFRHGEWIEIKNDPELPGKTLATIRQGSVEYINFETNVVKSKEPIIEGTPISIQALEFGPDNLLYMSGYQGSTATRYNTHTKDKEIFSMGQAEGMVPFGNKMMFGVYAAAHIWELDTTAPIAQGNNPNKIHEIGNEQDRPFAMTTGDNKLFIGTIPKIGTLGGAISIYEENNWETYRNVVDNQSIMGLAYRDGKLYGSTTVWGGLGIDPVEQEAKMFVWDVEKKEKVIEFVPDIQLKDGQKPKTIGGLSFGPDGLLWGAAYGTIFAMDPDTFEIVKQEEIVSTNWNFSHSWSPVKLRWDDHMLYTTLGSKIVVIDSTTMNYEIIPNTKTNLMVLGTDGNIYYNEASMLKKITVSSNNTNPIKTYLDIENADFEDDLVDGAIPGWSINVEDEHTSLELSEGKALSGKRSLRLVDATTVGQAALESNLLEVESGKEYTVGASVYLGSPVINPETGKPFSTSRTLFQVRYYDEDRNLLNITRGLGIIFDGALGQWNQNEFTVTPPAEAKYMVVRLASNEAYVSNAYYDDVYVFTEEEPAFTEVQELSDLTVQYGTEKDNLDLPKTVITTLNNGSELEVEITWDQGTPEYDGNIADTYVFMGSLELPEGLLNPDGLKAKINVIVLGNHDDNPEVALEALAAQLQDYLDAGEVRGPLVKQLENSLKQAEHHLNKGSVEKAAQFVEKFLKHLNNRAMQDHIDDDAKIDLSTKAENVIKQLDNQ